MKAVVTGGAGFIGSHLAMELINQGAHVSVIDNLVSGQKSRVPPLARFYQVDICSHEARRLIVRDKPDVVFHLAAQTDVKNSLLEPAYDAEVNIRGTINLLYACREAGVGKFVFASTSAVYGNLQKDCISEDDAVLPISYYGLSKWTAESYIRLFNQLFAIPYTILRFSNVYGPGQTPKGEGGVVAVFNDRIRAGNHISIHGDGRQTRDFIFVKDVVRAVMSAAGRANRQTVHVSWSTKTSINELAQTLSRIHGFDVETVHTAARKGDIRHSCLDNQKARRLLDWQPQTDLRTGLSETYAAAKNQYSGDEENEAAGTQRNV
jgi:UDP-glucose 4-epimerase